MASRHASEMSAFERERALQIERNKKILEQLGMFEAKQSFKETVRREIDAKKPPPTARRVVERRQDEEAEPPRRSGRTLGFTPKYCYDDIYQTEYEPRSHVKRRPAISSARLQFDVGFNNTIWPDSDAVDAALKLAEAAEEKTNNPTGVKVMLPSHVSGGYWLQMPCEFTTCLNQEMGKHTMTLLDPDSKTEWPVIWLRRGKSGGGLSGGWRGFAIDHVLSVGDVLMFEKVSTKNIMATIFRALSEAERKELKGAMDVDVKQLVALKAEFETDLASNSEEISEKTKKPAAKRPKKAAPPQHQKEDNEESFFEVDQVLEHRNKRGKMEYLVSWQGYSDQTWEPRASFVINGNTTPAVMKYEKKHGITA